MEEFCSGVPSFGFAQDGEPVEPCGPPKNELDISRPTKMKEEKKNLGWIKNL